MANYLSTRLSDDGFRESVITILLVVACLVLMLSYLNGCAAIRSAFGISAPQLDQNQQQVDAFFGKLQAASLQDLQAANQSAVAHQDTLAMACWPALIQFVSALQKDPAAIGPFSFYQRLRNLRRAVDTGVPDSLRLACSAMVQDSRDAVLRFMGQISTIAGMAAS